MENLKSKLKNQKGFSLVELLVVITIIAILSVVAYSAVGGQTIKAKDSKRKQDLNTMQSMLESYFVEYSQYPKTPLVYCTTTPPDPGKDKCITKKHLSDIPTDPGNANPKRSYVYAMSGATYQIAATLENDGALDKYTAYVVGNSDTPLIKTGYKYVSGSFSSQTCDVVNGKDCLPYNPNN